MTTTIGRRLFAGASVAVLAAFALVHIASASVTTAGYVSALESAGHKVSVEKAAVDHAGLKVDGRLFEIERADGLARVELIEYASRAKLLEDWDAVAGTSPKPRVATDDFDGAALYWNENAVLAVSYAPPNAPAIARAAADVFLGRTRAATPTPRSGVGLPNTGDGAGGTSDELLLGLVLSLGAIGVVAGGLALGAARGR